MLSTAKISKEVSWGKSKTYYSVKYKNILLVTLLVLPSLILKYLYLSFLSISLSFIGFALLIAVLLLLINWINRKFFKQQLEYNLPFFEEVPVLRLNLEGLEIKTKRKDYFFEWRDIQDITYVTEVVSSKIVDLKECWIKIMYVETLSNTEISFDYNKEFEFKHFFYNDLSPDELVEYLKEWKNAMNLN